MKSLRNILNRILTKEEGATAVEYAILLTLILVVAISAVLRSGNIQRALWFNNGDQLQLVTPTGPQL